MFFNCLCQTIETKAKIYKDVLEKYRYIEDYKGEFSADEVLKEKP
jgi:hypothetical protein